MFWLSLEAAPSVPMPTGMPAWRRAGTGQTPAPKPPDPGHYAAIYRRFLAWLADELGRPPPARISAPSVGGHGGGGLSSGSLRLECSALRQLARHAGRPELAASLYASRQQAPARDISPAQYERAAT
jgi:hypothetical protein